MKVVLVFIFSLIMVHCLFGQEIQVNVHMTHKKAASKSDTIYYDFDRLLTWADFQGAPVMNHPGGAVTASGFAFNADMQAHSNLMTINIYIYTFFTKHDSWKKATVQSAYHLQHEQRHFDITRLGAEQLLEAYREADFTLKNYRSLMDNIFQKVYAENIQLQQQYDSETKNSMNVEKQLEWNQRINAALLELKVQ